MTAYSLIEKARRRLGDIKSNRWTDQRLLDIVNEGQADICRNTGIYRKEAYVELANYETRYILPDDCLKIKRLEFRGVPIPVVSREDIDNGKSPSGLFLTIKDSISMGLIDIYPAITTLTHASLTLQGEVADDTFSFNSLFGVVTDMDDPYILDSVYGAITDVSHAVDPTLPETVWGELTRSPAHPPVVTTFSPDVYGVTTDIEFTFSTDPKLFGFISDSDVYKVVGKYGLITSIAPIENTLRVFYEAVPVDLFNFTTELVISNMWEKAMMHYLVGTALQDDNDSNNIQRGELELSKYEAVIAKAKESSSKDFSGGASDKYHTRMRRV